MCNNLLYNMYNAYKLLKKKTENLASSRNRQFWVKFSTALIIYNNFFFKYIHFYVVCRRILHLLSLYVLNSNYGLYFNCNIILIHLRHCRKSYVHVTINFSNLKWILINILEVRVKLAKTVFFKHECNLTWLFLSIKGNKHDHLTCNIFN